MLRVALITGNYNYMFDGVAFTMNRLVEFLERRGVPVEVFAPTKPAPVFCHAGTLVSVPSVPLPRTPYRLAVGLPPAARRRLRAFAPTLVHLCTPDLLGAAALRWARFHGVPAVTTYHTHFSYYLRYYRLGFLERLSWRAQRWFYNRCREVYVAAGSMGDELRRHGIAAPLVEAPFGVDTDQFRPEARSPEWRRALGIADDECVVCFVGRLVWEKGLAAFAETLNRLAADGVKFRTLIVGDGPAREGLRAKLPQAVFTGFLGGDVLPTAVASADVFFFPSASETFGCVTVEAMACGLPVVVADAPGSRDIVRDGTDGLVCPVGDAGAFAGALRRLIDNPAERDAFRAASLARAAEYQWDLVHARMLDNFRRVAAGG